MFTTENTIISTKRKLDDDDEVDQLVYAVNKMCKHDQQPISAVNRFDTLVSASSSSSSSTAVTAPSRVITCDAAAPDHSIASPELQFFVKMISEGKTIVLRAKRNDTVENLHERVYRITGIPVIEQRFLYKGKQLSYEQTLRDCGVEKDAGLQLVGRMRSTKHPVAWQVIGEAISLVMRLCKGELMLSPEKLIQAHFSTYLSNIPSDGSETTKSYLDIFLVASAPTALMMLYGSENDGNKKTAIRCIQHFLNSCIVGVAKHLHVLCVPAVLEFCKLLTWKGHRDKGPVYKACRYTLGVLMEGVVLWTGTDCFDAVMSAVFSFINELKSDLCRELSSSLKSHMELNPSREDVKDFIAFLHPVKNIIKDRIGVVGPIPSSLDQYPHFFVKQVRELKCIYDEMMEKMNMCLHDMEYAVTARGAEGALEKYSGWSQYLPLIKELNGIAKLYQGAEEGFWNTMRLRRDAVRPLIIRYANRTDDHSWILGHNDVTDFESRRHLVLMMLPEIKDEYDDLHEMLIDRPKLLEESFAYIAHADPESLHAGLFMEFKNEEATGPGVLREWFFMVCQALFSQQNALFVACQDDPRRFYPNPASKVDPLHLEYFTFSGRMIALALMHRVQVGVLFARSFFLKLAGKNVSLEDIQDADPLLYSSCKKIKEMNADMIDSDVLGLTFVYEIEELGSRKAVELCPGGKSIVVNSKNRSEYIDLLVQHRFVKSVTEQVAYFAKGFGDMLCDERFNGSFFKNIELEDFDLMLYGSDDTIDVMDWKAHTDYNGFKATDSQIVWFWKVVGEMSFEQKKILLFFWTSVKHLPYNGFRGLASRLCISRVPGTCNRLPSSHTCFYKLCLPAYPSMTMMRARLKIILQEHVSFSFGTW